MVVLAVTALAFSGCTAGGDGNDGDADASSSTGPGSASTSATATSGTSSASSTSAPSSSSSPAPNPNDAPVATIAANVTSGTAPLPVRFTLVATDADGDSLTYTFLAGDGSAAKTGALPATINHTFTTVGNYTAKVTASDGKLTNTATVSIAAQAATAAAAIPPPVTFTGTATGACQVPDPTSVEPNQDPFDFFGLLGYEVICVPMDAEIKHAFTVNAAVHNIKATLTWTFGAPAATDLDLYVLDDAGAIAGSSACPNLAPVPADEVYSCNRDYSEEAVIEGVAVAASVNWVADIIPFQAPQVPYTLVITYS